MSLLNRIADRVLKLPPPVTRDIEVRRGLKVPMADGIELLADLYVPRRVPGAPTVLVRTPYGRGTWVRLAIARPFAERGYQVLIQSCRGTAGSGGEFDPFGTERADGLATQAASSSRSATPKEMWSSPVRHSSKASPRLAVFVCSPIAFSLSACSISSAFL